MIKLSLSIATGMFVFATSSMGCDQPKSDSKSDAKVAVEAGKDAGKGADGRVEVGKGERGVEVAGAVAVDDQGTTKISGGAVEVDGANDKVEVSGGAVKVDGDKDKVEIGGGAVKVDKDGVDLGGVKIPKGASGKTDSKGGACLGGGCKQSCADGATCAFTCSGANCKQSCGQKGDCDLSCSGGNCEQTCKAGAQCDLSCSGGNCKRSCAGASCKKSCSGDNCTG